MSLCGIVLGTRGQGKSTLAKSVVRRYHTAVFYFDPNQQFYSPLEFSDSARLQDFLSREQPQHFEIVFRPQAGMIEDQFSEMVLAIRGAGLSDNFGIVIDEASLLQSPHTMNPELEWLIRQAPQSGRLSSSGRAFKGVTVIQTSHRPIDYHGDVRSLVSDWWIFPTRYQKDIDWIRANLPRDIAEQALMESEGLRRFQCVHVWFDGGQGKFSVWRNSEKWNIKITR